MSAQILMMVRNSTGFTLMILLLLLVFSIVSLAIFVERILFYKKLKRELASFCKLYETSEDPADFVRKLRYEVFSHIPFVSDPFKSVKIADITHTKKKLKKQLEIGVNNAIESLYAKMEYLSMITSIAPFLGLLGTVWGIMMSFMEIGVTGEASLAVVAPGIAEALITTIAGLVVAIPASLFFGYFNRQAKKSEAEIINTFNVLEGSVVDVD